MMKKITYYLLCAFFVLISCQQEDTVFETALKKSKDDDKNKVDICHKGKKTLNIHIDSVEDHLGHGDSLGPCNDDPDENYVLVPDNNFEQALIDLGLDDELDNLVLSSNISSVEQLDVREQGISDLTGIEGFTNLVNLNCSRNDLSVLDLSENSQLEILNCFSNGLLSLNVANNTELVFINCNSNKLTTLDVSNSINLKTVFANANLFSSLDFSNNAVLEIISCRRNRNLEALNVKNGNNSNVIAFDARFAPNLSCIEVDDALYSETNWPRKDAGAIYSEDCSN